MLDPQLWVGAWNLFDFSPDPNHRRYWGKLEIDYHPPTQGNKGEYNPAGGLSGTFVSSVQDRKAPLQKMWAFSAPPSPGRGILSAELIFPDGGHTVIVLRLNVRRDEVTGAAVADRFWGSYVFKDPTGQFNPDPWFGIRIVEAPR